MECQDVEPEKIQSEVMEVVLQAVSHIKQSELKDESISRWSTQVYQANLHGILEMFTPEEYRLSRELRAICCDILGRNIGHTATVCALMHIVEDICFILNTDIQHLDHPDMKQLVNEIFTLQYDITSKRAQRYLR